MSKIRAAVLGASGYIGGEVVRLLLGHPEVDVTALGARESAGKALDEIQPNLRGRTDLRFKPIEEIRDGADVFFLSLPHGEAHRVVPALPRDAKVIDLSGDFRLSDRATWEAHYKMPHAAWELQREFVYGVPEINRARLRESRRVAVGGCFATCAILSCWPLVKEKRSAGPIVIDGKTGSSGSGAKPGEKTHHPFRAGAFFAYEPFHHRHTPEIRQALGGADVLFQPHSAPMVRGVFTTSYVPLAAEPDGDAILELYRSAYAGEKFVRVGKGTSNVAHVRGSNFIDVGVAARGRMAIIFGAIDNLIKGGAGQAVQCMNIMYGLPEDAGLNQWPSII
ncbi:MAG: N-acetyl-gamma-glutamyl-phosphate reductase [Planctomycetes bacterium]|nr:N-acetyl-gamma-glutamyl-phosphate reductase [Planctomycetota bacterium]